MQTVSLISLVVEYEVPPSLIIDAIVKKRLRPMVRESPSLSLDDITFDAGEVSNIFWAYELIYKSEEMKAELRRRLQRHDNIVAAIIGAVAGSAITAVVAEAFSSLAGQPDAVERPASQGLFGSPVSGKRIKPPPKFRMPINAPDGCLGITNTLWDMRIARRKEYVGEITLVAAAPGIFEIDRVPGSFRFHSFVVIHGTDWISEYGLGAGSAELLAANCMSVDAGQPLVEIGPSPAGSSILTFRILRRRLDGEWERLSPSFLIDR